MDEQLKIERKPGLGMGYQREGGRVGIVKGLDRSVGTIGGVFTFLTRLRVPLFSSSWGEASH